MILNKDFISIAPCRSYNQSKSDEWHLFADSRANYFGVAMANGQIGL
jgi:hypothetical protein